MGLFDFSLDNLDDPKKMGLLMAAAGLMQGQQGKRSLSADLSRGLLGGAQGYAQAQQAQQELAQRKLQQQLMNQQLAMGGLNLQNAQQDFADMQTARGVFANRRGPQDPNASGNLDSAGTPSLYGGQVQPFQQQPPQMPPQSSQMGPQGIQPSQGGPTVIPFGKGVTATNAPQGASNGKFSTFNKYNSIADELEQAGALKQAQQYRDLAEKYRPKLKDEQVRLKNGVPMVVRNYEDGTTEESPYNPTANVDYVNTGGAQTGIDKYTGKTTGNTIKNTMSPGDAASNAIAAARLKYDTGMSAGGSAPGAGGGAQGGTPGGLPPAVQAQIAKSQQEGLNAGGVAYKTNLDNTVSVGNDLMMRIQESKKALDQFKPGMGAEARLNVARTAQMLGMPDGLVNGLNAGDVGAKQEFMKLSAQQAMETLKQSMGGSGRITQAEFKVFQQNNPNIELDPNAIKKIYDFAQRVHSRDVAEQSALTHHIRRGGQISEWPTIWSQQTNGGMVQPRGIDPAGIQKSDPLGIR